MKKLINKILKLLRLKKEKRNTSNSEYTTSIVITGVETSPKWGRCSGAIFDCKTFQNIISKCATNYDLTILKNENATVNAWTDAVKRAVQKPLAIIFYSGHGGTDPHHILGSGKNEEDGIDEFLCLYDKPLLDDDIWKLISESKGRVFLVFDCCHSGTMFRTANSIEDTAQADDANKFMAFERFATEQTMPNMLCWSACHDDNVAIGNSKGGVFTNTINKLYNSNLTYEEIWNKLYDNKALNDIEVIQLTEFGKSFKTNLFCR